MIDEKKKSKKTFARIKQVRKEDNRNTQEE